MLPFAILIVVGIAIFAFVFGTMDNNRPVASWSSDKLHRMHLKLLKAANAQFKLGNYSDSTKYSDKAKEVDAEIKRRGQLLLGLVTNVVKDATVATAKLKKLIDRTMAENTCNRDQAAAIVSEKLGALATEYVRQGLNQNDANEKALAQLLGS